MWVKIIANSIAAVQSALPPSEQLPDGRWVTGFPTADPATIEAAGWYSAPDPAAQPNNGFQQTLVWSWNGIAASSTWVQGAAIPPNPRTVAIAAATTLTDLKEAVT